MSFLSLLSVIIKVYTVILLFRWILTQQELTFNTIGRGVALLTDPLLKAKGRIKSESDKLIPLIIFLITLLYCVFIHFISKNSWHTSLVAGFREMVLFLTLFFVICILLGSMASPKTGALPLFFYRLGNIWVKLVRKIMPLKGNIIIMPAIILILMLFLGVDILLKTFDLYMNNVPADYVMILAGSTLTFVIGLLKIIQYLVILIIIRALLSWVSPDPRNAFVQLVYYITEPIIAPVRKVIPPIGMIDISAIIAIAILSVIQIGGMSIIASIVAKYGIML